MSRIGLCARVIAIAMSIAACTEERVAVEQEDAQPPVRDISGLYDVETAYWYGPKFRSQLRIKPLGVDNRTWQLVDARHPRQNLALQDGDVLGVAYTAQSGPEEFVNYFGIAIYEMDGTTFRGRWLSSSDPTSVEEEVLSCPKEIIGECIVLAGDGPGGQATAQRRVTIKPSHAGYWVTWSGTESKDRIFGIGFARDGKLVVAFGRDIFPAVEACRIRDVALECTSSAGDFRNVDRASLTRR